MQRSVAYVLTFAAIVCVVCGILVSSSAVSLKELQDTNAELERKTNVLLAADLATTGEKLDAREVDERFVNVLAEVVTLETGQAAPHLDPATFDQQKAKLDPQGSRAAPPNAAGIKRLADHAIVYRVINENGDTKIYVLPIEGLGLWSTLYGFVALDADLTTVRGLTFYQHGETPGLGGEVDNPRWKALWPGRRIFNDAGALVIEVIKGNAGTVNDDPHRVDGISGATITSRGVARMLHFWLGDDGFGPFLKQQARKESLEQRDNDAATEA